MNLIEKHIEKLMNGNLLEEKIIIQIIESAKNYYSSVPNIIDINTPITVVNFYFIILCGGN
jgi:hypothetical protein